MRRLGLGEVFGVQEVKFGIGGTHYCKASALPDVIEHAHQDAHFVFVIDGAYETAADSYGDYRGPWTLVYNPPGTEHIDRFVSATGRFASLHISANSIESEDIRLPDSPVCIGDPIVAARFVAGALTVEADSTALDAVSAALLADVGEPSPEPDFNAPDWLSRVTELMNDVAGHENVSVAHLAASAGVTPVYLARAFRRHHGIGPRAFLRRLRMRNACGLLATTRLPLAEIASLAGYADQSHFSREFKTAIGATPRAVREASL